MNSVVALIAAAWLLAAMVFAVGTFFALFSKEDRGGKIRRRIGGAVASFIFAILTVAVAPDKGSDAPSSGGGQQDVASIPEEPVALDEPDPGPAPESGITIGEYREISQRKRDSALGVEMAAVGVPENEADAFSACLGYYIPQNPEETKLSVAVGWCDFDRINNPEKYAAHLNEMDEPDMSTEAAVICSNLVRSTLKAPSSAKFPWVPDMSRRPNRDYYITSYVDAQNGFGAMIRTDFTCNVRYVSDDFDAWDRLESWEVVELNFNEM